MRDINIYIIDIGERCCMHVQAVTIALKLAVAVAVTE